jgi:hypothetical protein
VDERVEVTYGRVRFGFELEMFLGCSETPNGVRIPSMKLPVDGFPGLVEFRSRGGTSLEEAWAQIAQLAIEHDFSDLDLNRTEARFTSQQISAMRKMGRFNKPVVHVRNVYGKRQRELRGLTMASCQINMSLLLSSEYKDDKGVVHAARYGLLPCEEIVRALDKEFSSNIKSASRQPGMYAIKDDIRLEYRSLPNKVFSFNPGSARSFLRRVKDAVKLAMDGEHVY